MQGALDQIRDERVHRQEQRKERQAERAQKTDCRKNRWTHVAHGRPPIHMLRMATRVRPPQRGGSRYRMEAGISTLFSL